MQSAFKHICFFFFGGGILYYQKFADFLHAILNTFDGGSRASK